MTINAQQASLVFTKAANAVKAGRKIDPAWAKKIEHLSALCAVGKASTHIAFLGTSILAKATSSKVDLKAIKPDHAPGNSNAYSARILSETVIVPLAAEHGVHIGVTGRQPLNNQPYFRMTALGDGTPVHIKSKPAFDYMMSLVDELMAGSTSSAKTALIAFIAVRQRYWPRYESASGAIVATAETLAHYIDLLVRHNSEGGARAQAAAAGLLDVFAGDGRVASGRINDPSRHYPGDVCVVSDTSNSLSVWEKAIEVRDKPVTPSDIRIFCTTCVLKGAREAAVLMVAAGQPALNDTELRAEANAKGIGLTLFYGWDSFTTQALFWASSPKILGVAEAVDRIEARLIEVEASPDSVSKWHSLTRSLAVS